MRFVPFRINEKLARLRARTPTVLQMEATECGAACLTMVMAYHGLWLSLEQVREACGVTRDGSKAHNILKAARRYGLFAKGFKKEPDGLKALPFPIIVHWNFSHFVVLEGFFSGRAYINDPASGPRDISLEEFSESFTGVALVFELGPDFKPQGCAPRLLDTVRPLLASSRPALALILISTGLLVLPGVAAAGFSKIFVDSILIAQHDDWLVPLILGILLAAILRLMLVALQQKYLLKLEIKLALMMAATFFKRMLSLPVTFFYQRHAGDLGNRVAANDRIATLLSGELATTVLNLGTFIFYIAAIAAFSITLAAATLVLSVCNIAVLGAVARYREDKTRAFLNDGGRLTAATVGIIRSIESLKAGGLENDAFAQWSGYQAKTLNAQQDIGLLNSFVSAVPVLTTSLTTAAILGLGGLAVMKGSMTIGALVAVQSLASSLSNPVATLVQLGGRIQTIKGDFARISDVNAYRHSIPQVVREFSEKRPHGQLEIRNLKFGYAPLDAPLFESLSLTIKPGSRVAIVGGSGSGKSTVGRLMCGMISPWEGEVLLDGVPLGSQSRLMVASALAYVDQDIFLFEGSLRDNLTLWDDAVDEPALARALADAEVLSEILARPGRWDCHVDEGGTNFSGGQKQRIELARALLNDPAILILDEATAALDPILEKAIDDNIRRRGCSCVIIAHRLSTIRDCDEIIVLSRGQIIERGTHQDLMAAGGEYTRLLSSEG